MAHDYEVIAKQFLRALRGERSQVAFSRRLGFSSNVAAQWESGRRIPRVLTAFAACERARVDVRAALAAFRPSTARYVADTALPLGQERLAGWLEAQRGKETVSSIARRASLSRHQTARFSFLVIASQGCTSSSRWWTPPPGGSATWSRCSSTSSAFRIWRGITRRSPRRAAWRSMSRGRVPCCRPSSAWGSSRAKRS